MNPSYFSPTYRKARKRLLRKARSLGARIASHELPTVLGLDGKPVAIDIVWLGPWSARHVLFVVSGTHGVEGYVGSACQLQLLETVRLHGLPADTAIVLVHALNPFGFDRDTRQDEGWRDLNRNFLDWRMLHEYSPSNELYAALHDFFTPSDLYGPGWRAALEGLRAFVREHGEEQVFSELGKPQFHQPDGLYFPGTGPGFANDVLRAVLRGVSNAGDVVFVDVHSGLGSFGVGTVFSPCSPGSSGLARTVEMFGAEVQSLRTKSLAYDIAGTTADAATQELIPRGVTVTPVFIEFGTVPRWACIEAQMASCYGHRHDVDHRSPLGEEIRERMRAAYVPDCDEWRAAVLERAAELFDDALSGLVGPEALVACTGGAA